MKKLILVALAATFLFTSLNAQMIDLKVNPIGLLFNSPDISGEYVVNEDIGVELGLGFDYGDAALGLVDLKKSGFSVLVVGKYYFNPDDGCDNFFAGIYLRPRSLKFTGTSDSGFDAGYKQSAFAAGLMFGKKWVGSRNILFEISAGAGRAFNNKITYNDSNNTSTADGLGLDWIGRLAIGYRLGGE